MPKLTLYHAAPSRSSIVHWMLEELGEPYDIHLISFKKGENLKPEFLAVNPMGKLPTIKHGDADHQAWLKEAIDAHFAGQPVPEPRGKGRKEAERDALREALAKCHDRFRHYEQMHRLKYSADGNEKADRNREMAEMCEAALARSLSLVSREEN